MNRVPDVFISRAQAARLLNCSPATVTKVARENNVRMQAVSGLRTKFSHADLASIVERGTLKGGGRNA